MTSSSPKTTRAQLLAPVIQYAAVCCLLGLFAVQATTSMAQKSATWDETHYLGIGAYLLQTQQWNIPSAKLHPPLSFYLNSLPLIVAGYDTSDFRQGPTEDYVIGVKRGQGLLAAPELGGEKLLFWARIPLVVLGIVLGYFVFLWSTELFGLGGGFVSLVAYCVCPNLVAHAQLITPDICLTATGFIAFYFFRKACLVGSMGCSIAAGIFLGLALLSKYSALLWPPMFVVATFTGWQNRTGATLRLDVIPFLVAAIVLALGYGFQLNEFVSGLVTQYELASRGHEPTYLLGQLTTGGWFYYYLVALLVKLTIPLLLLIGASSFFAPYEKRIRWSEAVFIWLPIVGYLGVFSLAGNVNNGVRYVLPALPFLVVWIGAVWPAVAGATSLRCVRTTAVGLLLAWHAYAGLSIYPHYLAYFNEIAGGPQYGHRWLLDSNLDWGQDLKGLAAYMRDHGIKEVKLSYFGTADPRQYNIEYEALPSMVLLNPARICRRIEPGDYIAVSINNLMGLYLDLGDLGKELRAQEPIASIGHTIYIYRAPSAMRIKRS